MKFSEDLHKLLPFGYLFLVVMGIIEESVFYYQIGINILKYSTLMDILISPIATLTSNPIVLLSIVIFVAILYAIPKFLAKKSHTVWAQKLLSLKNKEAMTSKEIENHFTQGFVKFLAVGLLSFFLGIGIGQGLTLKKRIANGKLNYNNKLNLISGESEQIHLIGLNSIYYFYLAKGNKAIKIVPISSVKNMELTNNRMLK